jgi:purine-binding chemotaxis protein CheW
MTNTIPVTRQQVFRNRAMALAAKPPSPENGRPTISLVEIRLAHERYAVESAYVREVLPLKDVTPLPCTPAFVLGLINVRGQIMSVIDLRVFFDLPRLSVTTGFKVIILKSGDMEVGVVADAVVEARSLPLDSLSPALPTLTGLRAAYLRGIAEGDLVVLDAAKLLADKSIVVNEQVDGE